MNDTDRTILKAFILIVLRMLTRITLHQIGYEFYGDVSVQIKRTLLDLEEFQNWGEEKKNV